MLKDGDPREAPTVLIVEDDRETRQFYMGVLAADGWLVLRFASRHVNGPTAVVDRTRRALLSRGWDPTSS